MSITQAYKNVNFQIKSVDNRGTYSSDTGNIYFQDDEQQFDLANENARLDDIYPEYTEATINIDGKERTVYNSNGDRIAKSEQALRNFYK